MSWSVVVRPKRKNDVHGVAISLVPEGRAAERWGGDELEALRISFFRRPDVAAQHDKPFEKVLEEGITAVEAAARKMSDLDAKVDTAIRKTINDELPNLRKELEKLIPQRKSGPEFE